MARVKISEYKAKELLYSFLKLKYSGLSISSKDNLEDKIKDLENSRGYVVKVDQGVKKRNKLGLVAINIPKSEILLKLDEYAKKGYANFLIEEYIDHEEGSERFIAMERTREGILCTYTKSGGVNVEEARNSIKSEVLSPTTLERISKNWDLNADIFEKLYDAFDKLHLSFLESNPFIILEDSILLLDLAIEVDSAAEFFVNGLWDSDDFIDDHRNVELEEKEIKKLAEGSSASFKLVVLNPEGSIFTIFSGGGASIVLADEINNAGKGGDLANYAEYSGGPTEEETYIFAKNILSLALRSPARNKKIYIAGGVANFTDIRATFKGVIKALEEKKEELRNQGIKVYVRRGGPFQEEGLSLMKNFLDQAELLGEVMGPDRVLTEVVTSN